MRIGFLVKDIDANGGVERVVSTLANYFVKEYKYKIKIISEGCNEKESIYKLNDDIEVEYLNYKFKKGNSFYLCLNELLFLRKKLSKEDIDVIITTTTFHNLYFAIMKPFLKYKVIASHHEEFSYDTEKWNKLKKIFYKNLDAVITLTNSDYEKYKEFNHNAYVIPNPLPYERQYLYNENNKKIVTVGRLSIEKSIDYSIRAFSKLVNKYSEWSLEIVGDGPDKERLLNIIGELNLNEKVSISGFCNNIIDKYKMAGFLILTSQKEGFGCVLIESNAVGVPVISFDNIGPKEIIKDGFNGYLVEKNDEDKLALCMEKLIKDVENRNMMSKNSYELADKYSVKKICDKWNEIIRSKR